MRDIFIVSLRISAFFLSLLLFYTLFLYEDEERALDKKFRNRLSEWWIKIDETKHHNLSRHVAFMREIAKIIASTCDRVFGEKLLSLRALGVSTWYWLGSFLLFGAFNVKKARPDIIVDQKFILAIIILIILPFIYGTLPAFIKKRTWLMVWFIPLFIIVLLLLLYLLLAVALLFHNHNNKPMVFVMMLGDIAGWVLGVLLFTVFVAITRRILRKISRSESFWITAAFISLNCIPLVILTLATYLLAGLALYNNSYMNTDLERVLGFFFFVTLTWMIIVNVAFALLPLVSIVLAIFMIGHRTFWSSLDRPIYALQKIGIVGHKKLAFILGVVLVGYSLGVDITGVVKDIIGIFKG
ncbi:MAG TPA: hypothetical protein VJ464_10035 [Blastocatellia bacterium]|nr:hypothetical protein [Blastocatellia bacterium]